VKPLTLERLRREGEEFMVEVSREQYLTGAGHKQTAALQPIYRKHAAVLSEDSLNFTLENFRAAAADSEEQRSARLLAEWQAEAQSSRELAEHDEREIEWEATAMATLYDGRRVPYQELAIEIGNATDRRERLALDAAREKLVEKELAPLKRERLEREKRIVEQLEIAPSYNRTFEMLSGIELEPLAAECGTFLERTQAMWDEVLPEFIRRSLGIEPREATRADALTLMRAREFDAHFPAGAMDPSIRRFVQEMGIDAGADGRVRFDIEDRPGKNSRAFCAPVLVPDEVYLVLRPHGGQTDYRTYLHELGHALHFAHMRSTYPFEYRWLGDNSVTEGYAMLFDHLVLDRGWLVRYTELGKPRAAEFLRSAAFEELHALRRYCAKLRYEVQLYGGGSSWDSLQSLYADSLTEATGFRYSPADAFVDVDPRFYSARYLRAWQLEALLADSLVERFNEDWFRNPHAGPWMVENLFAEGQRELGTEQAQRVAGKTLSFAPLARSLETLLS
jgi:hypothetical protein